MIPQAVRAALALSRPCIPVKTDKTPFFPWTEFQSRLPAREELTSWYEKYSPKAWAVITGQISGLVVLDFDGQAGANSMRELGLAPHVRTPSGGFHVYLEHPGWRVRTVNQKSKRELRDGCPGLDVRADGGYAVFWGATARGRYEILRPLKAVGLEVLPASLRGLLDLAAPPAPVTDRDRAAHPTPSAPLERALVRISSGGRNNSGFWLACQLRDAGYGVGEAALVLRDFRARAPELNTKGEPEPYTVEDALATVSQAYSRPPRSPLNSWRHRPDQRRRSTNGGDSLGQEIRSTDLGNAQRLIARHGHELRFCHQFGRWLIWDGRRWAVDETDEVMRRAKDTVCAIYREAASLTSSSEREPIAKHAIASERESRLRAMVDLARSEPGIPVRPSQLDSDPWRLNCLNGTIDLRTGELLAHRADDLITKLAPVEYDPAATSALWDRVVREACGNSPAMMGFLQRAVGYSLTGDTSEEKLFFIHGPAATGKSTILEAVKGVLGNYAVTSDFETLLRRRDVGAPRNDVARLAGYRFVISVEVDEGRRIAEGLVKQLTGGDTISARFLYRESFEFLPSCKLWLAANRVPHVRSDDEGIWRRILRIPFENVIPQGSRDPRVKAELRDLAKSGPAILGWGVLGCLAWQRDRLGVPPEVVQATQAYREDMDPLSEFFEECCILDPAARASAATLQQRYQAWAREGGERFTLNRQDFATSLRVHGCTQARGGKGVRVWKGIGLRDVAGDAWVQTGAPGVAEGGAISGELGHENPARRDFPDRHGTSSHPGSLASAAIAGSAGQVKSVCDPGQGPDGDGHA